MKKYFIYQEKGNSKFTIESFENYSDCLFFFKRIAEEYKKDGFKVYKYNSRKFEVLEDDNNFYYIEKIKN